MVRRPSSTSKANCDPVFRINLQIYGLERHRVCLLGLCCTAEQKDLLLMRSVVKNFFGNAKSKTAKSRNPRGAHLRKFGFRFFVVQANEVCGWLLSN